jgi:hypothetical protein
MYPYYAHSFFSWPAGVWTALSLNPKGDAGTLISVMQWSIYPDDFHETKITAGSFRERRTDTVAAS